MKEKSKYTAEELYAFVNGELSEEDSKKIEAEIGRDQDLQKVVYQNW